MIKHVSFWFGISIFAIILVWFAVQLFVAAVLPNTPNANSIAKNIDPEIQLEFESTTQNQSEEAMYIKQTFAPLIPLQIGQVALNVSVADTPETRTKGLSETPYLPTNIGKLFVFDTADRWSFWMKDMNYSIDIIWIDTNKTIVHIAEAVAPETFPDSFAPPIEALYVLETVAGFVAKHNIAVGDTVAFDL